MRPDLNHRGIVCENKNGEWHVKCVRRPEINRRGAEIAGEICSLLGFSGYSFFNVTPVGPAVINPRQTLDEDIESVQFPRISHHDFDHHLHLRKKREINSNVFKKIDGKSGIYYEEFVSAPNRCPGLYIECIPHAKIHNKNQRPDDIKPLPPATLPAPTTEEINEETTIPNEETTVPIPKKSPPVRKTTTVAPEPVHTIEKLELNEENLAWNVILFINGEIACSGILLDRFWLLAHKDCLSRVLWTQDMVVAVFGLAGSSIVVPSPREQIVRVDCIRRLDNSDYSLVHLFTAIQFNRQILPIMLPQTGEILSSNADCVGVSLNETGGIQTIALNNNINGCGLNECFHRLDSSELSHCGEFFGSQFVSIVCKVRSNGSILFPVALTIQERGLCSFDDVVHVNNLRELYANIDKMIGRLLKIFLL